MNPRHLLWLAPMAWALASAEAGAHYLFIRITPPAEAGRAAEVYFSEQAEAGDPRFIDKIAQTQLWLQKEPGKFEPLKVHKGADRLRASVPMSGSLSVVGVCDYGVLVRKNVPFLLRHYPKAVAGSPEELNKLTPRKETAFEIVAAVDGDSIHLTALRAGKPIPGAVFETVDAKLAGGKLTAGADGKATWKPGPGRYAVYTSQVLKEGGEFKGTKYDEVREFATLAFAWPLGRKEADPKAVALFEEAVAVRAQWKNFPGFTAQIAGKVDGRPFKGKVTIDAKGAVKLETDDDVTQAWVKDQLASIVLHRAAGDPSTERRKPELWFADEEEDHPLGRLLLFEGGRFASSYRVKDKQILVVNRHLGRQNMTITVLDNERNREGQYLPRNYTVQYWDAASSELRRTETVQDRWQRVGEWDLPAQHTVTAASETGLSVRGFTLTKHQLRDAK